jgi:hypothetical protein
MSLNARARNQQAEQKQSVAVKLDSASVVLKLNALEERKAELKQKIVAEDARRNLQIAGASALSLETINNRQDSLCLALRSQLVDVDLEIGELRPTDIPSSTVQQIINHTPTK